MRGESSTIVEKRALLSSHRASRLERLAAAQGMTENALIETALDILFQEQQDDANIPPELQDDWNLLRQVEEEAGPGPSPRSKMTVDPAEIVSFAGTPLEPENLSRLGG